MNPPASPGARTRLETIVKAYDVRGIVGDALTDDVVEALGAAFADEVGAAGGRVVVGHGAMVSTLIQAAALAESEGTSCEVIDLRSLSPVDYGPILESVGRTGRIS